MKIAIIGTGIAGNLLAHRLAPQHDITVFEAERRIGGHTHTVDVVAAGRRWAIDTGFIVYNNTTYPHFKKLLDELDVETQPSNMSFSVSSANGALEYSGSSLNTLFAQRRNLLRPSFYRMLLDILRFNREAPRLLDQPGKSPRLGDYLEQNGYSEAFTRHYIIPMGAAIWSATDADMRALPAEFFVRFFSNHGLLSVNERPSWRVISGGSRRYVDKLVAGHRGRIRTNCAVEWVRRHLDHIELKAKGLPPERFDRVFLACHSDQALQLLADPTPAERDVLGAIRYQSNEAVLHTDQRMMPRARRAWAAWNYHVPDPDETGRPGDGRVRLTYNMNLLQGLDAPVQFCVTLNHTAAIDPGQIIRIIEYQHPVFDHEALKAQGRHREINGARRTYFSGAYWRNGFHEDGVVSALNTLEHFHQDNPETRYDRHEKQDLSRPGPASPDEAQAAHV